MRQRGFSDLVVNGLIVLAVLGALSAVALGVNHWFEGVKAAAKEEGRNEIRQKDLKERNDRLVEAQRRIKNLEDERDAKEAEHAKHVAAIDAKGQEGIRNAQVKADRDIAAIRAGNLVMRDAGLRPRLGCPGSGDGAPGAAAAGAGLGDGEAGAQLQRQADAAFLRGEAGRADRVVEQLTACQAIVEDDRR